MTAPMIERLDYPLIMAWLLLLALGAVMVASTGIPQSETLLTRHAVYLLLSIAAFFVVVLIPLRAWEITHRLAWLVAALLCSMVLVIGVTVNGAERWISLGGFKLQPAEVAKFLLLIYLAGYLTRFADQLVDDPVALLKPLAMVAAIAGLLLAQPDFGTAVVLMATTCGLLFLAGARLRHFLLIVLVGGGGLLALAFAQPYRVSRMFSFIDPWAHATDDGYQLVQALIGIGRSGPFGLGLGESIQKLDYLPEAHNDFIFAIIAEEMGLIGAIGVIALFGFLVLRMLRLARAALDSGQTFAGWLIYGVAVLIGLQSLVNLGVNTGVLPTKGLTLPFVSYGGNSLIVCCAMLGLVCRAGFEMQPNGRGTRQRKIRQRKTGQRKTGQRKTGQRKPHPQGKLRSGKLR